MNNDNFQSYYYMATHTDIGREENRKKKWLDNIREDCEDINNVCNSSILPQLGLDKGETMFTTWAAGA